MKTIIAAFLVSCLTASKVDAAAYQDGEKEGRAQAHKIWMNYKKNCDSIFQYSVEVKEDLVNGKYKSGRGDNWYDSAFKRGGRDGASSEALKKQEECIQPDYCDVLGTSAAEVIVADFCAVRYPFGAKEISPVKYCRETSTATCKGKLYSLIKEQQQCPEIDDNVANLTRQQSMALQDECEDLVDEWIQWDDLKDKDSGNKKKKSDKKKKEGNKKKKSKKDGQNTDKKDYGYSIGGVRKVRKLGHRNPKPNQQDESST